MTALAIHLETGGIFEPGKKLQFEEYLAFTLSRGKILAFPEFQRNVGISRRQWDLFRAQNTDKKVKWTVD